MSIYGRNGRPSPLFVALRAAILGVDDLARKEIRMWFDGNTWSNTGEYKESLGVGSPLVGFIRMGYDSLNREERRLWNQWLMRWTDGSGRIITPSEHRIRLWKQRAEK